MRHSPGLLEDTSGVRIEPTLELGDRDQAKTATADKPQLGLDVGLERVEADAERSAASLRERASRRLVPSRG
jgi:hypothetical protein